eukprot:CAMPEP_0114498664 /NCGR_PEP_ID=MMETSP0109-20121206/6994_1 /TAXON_ID=29199 /ORGANISM="Chlorarachnion reptans, Strain CCCM449" /LENGTH=270 /DNA_ID=CAMNT_0001676159 /DNA_START=68 /DNA_END=880 /DNA_ORIENTATION=-
MAGLTSKIVEYPFDTIKVRLHTSTKYTSTIHCMKDMVATEGALSLFRGIAAPIAGAMLESSLMFWSYGSAARLLGGKDNLSLGGITFCGAVSGIPLSLWLTPVEYLKCRLQAAHTTSLYKGIGDCLVHTVKTDGIGTLFTGFMPTILREVPGGAVYFFSYEVLTRALTPKGEKTPPLYVMAGGGLAGLSYWCSIMPFDVIKSKMQTVIAADSSAQTAEAGVISTATSIFRTKGIHGFYTGISVTAPRAILSNAIIFSVYDYFKNLLDKVV